MASWKDLFRRRPGHLRKAKVIPVDQYEWPFVIISRKKGRKWQVLIFSSPSMKPNRSVMSLWFTGPDPDAIAFGAQWNEKMSAAYVKRRRQQAKEFQRNHDRMARRFDNQHKPGPISECPVCRAARGAGGRG